ncbi:MAG: Flp pilus assembly protein CpaB [Woeseiaceae bacterium]
MRAPLNVNLNRVTLFLILLALSAGILAAWFAQRYVNDEIAARRASLEAKYEPTRVLVALGDLPAGTRLDTGSVAARKVPAEFLHSDAIHADEFAQVRGRATRHDLTEGAPVLRSHLLGPTGGRFADLVEEGKRALTIPVDQLSSISGMLAPGDRVDILMTLRQTEQPVMFPLIRNTEVIATGERTDLLNQEPGRYNTVTIAATPEVTAKIIYAQEVGSLRVVLRNPDDDADDLPASMTLARLLGVEIKVPRPRRRPRPPVEIIEGGNRT